MTDDTMPVSLQWEVWAQRDGEVMFREAGFTMRCDAESWARMIIDEQGYEFSTFYAQVRGPDGFRKFFRMAQEGAFERESSGHRLPGIRVEHPGKSA